MEKRMHGLAALPEPRQTAIINVLDELLKAHGHGRTP
jgi:hypothetical protein